MFSNYAKKILFTALFIAVLVLFGLLNNNESAEAQVNISPDAIAIRVIPNDEHYSAQAWYSKKSFSGSPQNLIVDGYEAVRDGRTVYVNAGNVSTSLFTNIYVISYNQEAERPTVDIFGQILSRWKFNNNLLSQGHCRIASTTPCLMDTECSYGDNCDSIKARVVRDVARLADMANIEELLDRYYLRGYFPALNAGSYLANRSLSVWPSWQDAFASELGATLAHDPVNQIGDCPNYDPITCWNESTKSFATTWPIIPTNSLAYNYTSNPDGTAGVVCATMESGYSVSGVVPCSIAGCLDFDGDGFGNPGSTLCSAGSALTDCNDLDPGIQAPTGPENTAVLCGNTIDDDCDGLVDCGDPDCLATAPCSAVCGDFVCNGVASCPPCTALQDPDCAGECCGNGNCDDPNECLSGATPCLTDCFCGNGNIDCGETCDPPGAGCSASCTLIVPCTDFDHDYYIEENTAVGSCGNVCGPSNNQPCLGNNDSAANNCSDSDDERFPGNPAEVCDGKDNDCNGIIDDGETEESCQYTCTNASPNYVWTNNGGNLNCCGNDLFEPPTLLDYQANEFGPLPMCNDGIDNDCDGFCDTVNGDCWLGPPISQGDGECSGGCSNLSEDDHTGASAGCDQCGNNIDDDHDQTVPAFPTTELDWGIFDVRIDDCDPDCGQGASVIDWGNFEDIELTCDGLDNDCDGGIDNGLAPELNDNQFGVCAGSFKTCSTTLPGMENDYSAVLNNEWPVELSCDGLDNNCDNTIDEGITAPCGSNVGTCVEGLDSCVVGGAGVWTGVCVGEVGPVAEVCDGLDNNCDTFVDDGVVCGLNSNQQGECAGSSQICSGVGGCVDDYTGIATYEAAETTCDGLDNDCDGNIDNTAVCTAALGSGLGVCAPFTQTCTAGACVDDYSVAAPNWQAAETACADVLDNDCNGLCDLLGGACGGPDPNCILVCDFDFDLPCQLP